MYECMLSVMIGREEIFVTYATTVSMGFIIINNISGREAKQKREKYNTVKAAPSC
jgi:hypothetical protein